jgi:hypothetical protein
MKQTARITGLCLCTLLPALLFSCRAAVMESGTDTATIELTIPALVSGETETSASRAVLGYTGMTVSVTVDGSGFDSFTKTFSAILNTYVVALSVPKGTGRTFTVQAADTAGTVYAKGSTTADITDAATSLSVTLAPVVDDTVESYSDYYNDDGGSTPGVVKIIEITDESKLPLYIENESVSKVITEADGTILQLTDTEEQGDYGNIYECSVDTAGPFYLIYTPTNSIEYYISIQIGT